MTPFVRVEGVAAPLPIDDVDTDQILPAPFLKAISRAGLGEGLFHRLRHEPDGARHDRFVLDRPRYAGAVIMVSGRNFGSGSSREHAAWALLDGGIRCVIAESFGDIFYSNSLNCGLLPAIVAAGEGARLAAIVAEGPPTLTVDLTERAITTAGGESVPFTIGDGSRRRLLEGLDPVGETLARSAAIEAFEARRHAERPWLAAG